LQPAWIDPDSGYRYYSRAQVTIGRRIRLLRTMDMPLEDVTIVLEAWEQDSAAAQRLIQAHINAAEKHLETVQLVARLLLDELSPDKEQKMSFEFDEQEMAAQPVASIRRNITVPAYHEWMMPVLKQLWGHIEASEAENAGDPVALYYGPVNEKDDGPIEICVPFLGTAPPKGEIKIRELPAHKAVQIRTYGEYNKYPKLLEMWNAIGRYVDEGNLESNWDADMTTYEIWQEDETMTIGWPVRAFTAEVD
jgi:DNA-binding transcriptional MerR regulator